MIVTKSNDSEGANARNLACRQIKEGRRVGWGGLGWGGGWGGSGAGGGGKRGEGKISNTRHSAGINTGNPTNGSISLDAERFRILGEPLQED